MMRFFSIYLVLCFCMFCQADESFVDQSTVIDAIPETAVYENEMADLHQRALKSVRNYLLKQKQAQVDAKNYTKAAELEKRVTTLADELENTEIGEVTTHTKTFMDGRKWNSKETGAVYTVQNGKLYRNGIEAGTVQIIAPCILNVIERHEYWVWCSNNEAMRVDSSFLEGGSFRPTILTASDKTSQAADTSEVSYDDIDKLVQARYQNFISKNAGPIRKKYVKALTAKMDEYAKEGKLSEAAEIQRYISSFSTGTSAPVQSIKTPKRPLGKFLEIGHGGWSYIFTNNGWSSFLPSGKKVADSKIVRISPDKHVWVHQSPDSIECIFWHGDKLMRLVVVLQYHLSSHSRVMIRSK